MSSTFRVPRFTAAILRLLAVLALLVTGMAGRGANLSAQASATANVSIDTMQAQHGAFYDACYILVGFSNEGCDDNRDGSVTFMDVPVGTYTVHQTRDLGSTAQVPDFEITVTGQSIDGWETFETWVTHRSADSQANHIAIQTTGNGQPAYDVCYVLVGFSNEGCDDNQDGQVTFLDVPFGTYTVRQTADLGPNRSVPHFTIEVSDSGLKSGWLTFTATVQSQAVADKDKPIDIALITRDPKDGHLLTGACYVLVNYSSEGCDENNDGQVTFAQIPPGTYTVRQTTTPAGYPAINDYEIQVTPLGHLPNGEAMQIPLGFVVKQAPEQNEKKTRNVSLVLIDSRTNERLVSDICVEFVGASNVGCDEDLRDGQIDFLDVPAGTWPIEFSNLPAGWVIQEPNSRDGSFATIDASADTPAQTMIVYGVYVPETAGTTGTRSSDTWNASFQVILCETKIGVDCFAQGGIVVNISLASGEYLGSCTLSEPYATPWGVDISTCSVSGMPYNADFIASQDPTTIPAGYVPVENTLTLRVGNIHPGGGDQATFTFINVRASTGPTQSPAATFNITLRGCPEGVDPTTTDPATACTIPLDAPDRAAITFPDAMGHEMFIPMSTVPRLYDGTYQATVPANLDLQVAYFEPDVRDTFMAVGHEWTTPYGNPVINLAPGETGHVTLYYYFYVTTSQSNGTTSQATTGSATLLITMRGCPEGFNPNTDDFFANCTIPLDAPDASFLYHGGDGQGGMNIMGLGRQYDGAYIFNAGPNTMNVNLSGLAPEVRDGYTVVGADSVYGDQVTIKLVDGETRQVYVFYYYWP